MKKSFPASSLSTNIFPDAAWVFTHEFTCQNCDQVGWGRKGGGGVFPECDQKRDQAKSKALKIVSENFVLRWLDPVILWGYYPTLKLSGIPTFTSIVYSMDNI